MTMASERKRRDLVYFYDEEMTNYNFGGGNPMRPHRVKLTTQLINGYGLTKDMQLLRPVSRSREEIMQFHADGAGARPGCASGSGRRCGCMFASERAPSPPRADYVDFLSSVTPDNQEEFIMQMRRFNLGPVGEADCPVFDGMFEYFRVSKIEWV